MVSVPSERVTITGAALKELVNSLTAVTAYIEAVRHSPYGMQPKDLTLTLDKIAAQCQRAGVAVERLRTVIPTQTTV